MEHRVPAQRPEKRRKSGRFLPFLVIALIGLLILKEEVPAVNRWFQRVVAPDRYAAAEACRSAALDAATHPAYARVRDEGAVHETRNGFYVEGVEIGEMGADGAETTYRFNCYADPSGTLVKTHKDATAASP
ncbi:MAG: hypothetical protein WC383_00775 [Gammaproteobacteria bacterium]